MLQALTWRPVDLAGACGLACGSPLALLPNLAHGGDESAWLWLALAYHATGKPKLARQAVAHVSTLVLQPGELWAADAEDSLQGQEVQAALGLWPRETGRD